MNLNNCRICDNPISATYTLKEMMFGMRHQFPYAECPICGAVQITEIPENIGQYYPPYYISFSQHVQTLKRLPWYKRIVKNSRMRKKYRANNAALEFVQPLNLMPNAKILDVGCGRGGLICSLFNIGFEHVTGTDKFVTKEIDYGYGVKILKKDMSELPSNTYDLVMLHHVLEHMDEQVRELQEARRLLKKNGVLLICIPMLGDAWDIYRENWVQLDAPRHFVLHTLKSINLLAQKAGFRIDKTIFDSGAFQFWGSELYERDIPLTLPDTHEWYPPENTFTTYEMTDFAERAKLVNKNQRGDSARFYMYKN